MITVILLGMTACTGGPSPVTAPSNTAPTTSSGGQATAVANRRCGTGVAAPEGTAWREQAIVVGPFMILSGRWTPEAFNLATPHLPDGTRFLKTPVVVERGRQVTITLPPDERSSVALVYGDDPHARVRIDEGQYAVTFLACKPIPQAPPEFFNGGFLLRSPQCVTLHVSYEDRTQLVVLPFGTGRCPA